MAPTPSLEEIGGRESLLGSRFVGMMRAGAATSAVGAAVGAATVGLAHVESRFPTVRDGEVPIRAREGFHELRILQISDLHMFEGQEFIGDFLARVAEEEQFDFVVSTGDNLSDHSGVPLLLEALEPLMQYPGAFVLGSNDYYLPKRKPWISYLDPKHRKEASARVSYMNPELPWFDVVQQMVKSGWIDMSNRSVATTIPTPDGDLPVALVGVDDPHIRRDRFPKPVTQWDDPGAVRLALSHSPYKRVLDRATELGSDLILTGHTHGGQVRLPGFGAIVNNCDIPNKYSRGLYPWVSEGKRSWVNISAGLGTSRFAQIRFFCRPEVSLITLKASN